MKSRSKWQQGLVSKQRNLDPMTSLRNILSFEHELYSGIRMPTRFQVLGACVVGSTCVGAGLTIDWFVVRACIDGVRNGELFELAFAVFPFVLGSLALVFGVGISFRALRAHQMSRK